MKKNVIIALLSLVCLIEFACNAENAAVMRAAQWRVRVAGFHVWSQACQHAAAGDTKRSKWCQWAAQETASSAADSGVSDEDIRALALKAVSEETRQPK